MSTAYAFGDTSRWTIAELMACEISRWLTNGDTVVVWDDAPLGLAGARLAQLTHAPDLDLLLMPLGALNPAVDPLVFPLVDYSYLAAEAVLPWERAVAFLARGVDIVVAEVEGVDGHGDVVSRLDVLRPAAFPWLTSAKRVILYTLRGQLWHQALTVSLLPSADRRRVEGYKLWRVINPLASFEPAGRSRGLRIRSVHPGLGVEDVVRACGLELPVSEDLYTTLAPTRGELEALRRQIDPNGILRDMAQDWAPGPDAKSPLSAQ